MIICGVDEAGRGPLAGPLVASAVILNSRRAIKNLNDSKKLNSKQREVLYKKIVAGRVGISNWLPSFFYKLPWKSKQVQKYDDAKEIIVKKHKLV